MGVRWDLVTGQLNLNRDKAFTQKVFKKRTLKLLKFRYFYMSQVKWDIDLYRPYDGFDNV